MNQVHEPIHRTVSLLSVVEDKIRAEPHVFTEFVKILESEPTLSLQAKELIEKYLKGMGTVNVVSTVLVRGGGGGGNPVFST